MAIRHQDDDYNWVLLRNLRQPPRSLSEEDDSTTTPKRADRLIELATVVAGFAGVILLIDAVVIALR
jgi:hypothetical protein